MKKTKIIIVLACVIAALVVFAYAKPESESKPNDLPKVTVGVFDSRAVAIAFAHSEFQSKIFEAKKKQMDEAVAADDKKKIEELENWAKAQQEKLHYQGFGTASVDEYIEHIKDDIPKIAKQIGVDIIISKWDIVYKSPDTKFVDITSEIVKPFKPSEKTLKTIDGLSSHEPISEKQLKKMDHSH